MRVISTITDPIVVKQILSGLSTDPRPAHPTMTRAPGGASGLVAPPTNWRLGPPPSMEVATAGGLG